MQVNLIDKGSFEGLFFYDMKTFSTAINILAHFFILNYFSQSWESFNNFLYFPEIYHC